MSETAREPGIYDGISNAEYHQSPALSASGMKLLLEAPAKFDHARKNPTFKDVFDFGSLWHKLIFRDEGERFVIIQKKNKAGEIVDSDSRETIYAKAHMAEIREAGAIPVLATELTKAQAMVEAFWGNPRAEEYVDLAGGAIEQSAFWVDERSGVQLRARFDLLPKPVEGEPFRIVDGKTAASSEPRAWLRSAADYGMHIQEALYRRAVREFDLSPRPEFVFAIQEKAAPYLVSFVRLAARTQEIGDYLVEKAIATFKHCTETGDWSGGYVDDVFVDDLPAYYTNRFEGVA